MTPTPAKQRKIDAFWRNTLRLAAKRPLDAVCEPIKAPLPYHSFKVSYRGWRGDTINALLGVPINPPRNPMPAIVTAPGYGGWEQGAMLDDCQRGYLILQVFPRDQGLSGTTVYGQPRQGPAPMMAGVESPNDFYYRGAYVDVLRGVDYLASRPDADASRLGAMGTSQGGMLALAAGSLDARIKAVCAHVPAFCDLRNNHGYEGANRGDARRLDTYDFFDPAVLASRCRAATLVSSGGKDETCPPATIHAVYARLPGVKAIAHYPDLTHTSCGDFHAMGWDWMDRHLRG
ncbi:MAG: acetylxylan esterase [Planctomycetota bacterium]|nr:acetylxylan esterase [Planctomycetota bacterium]